MIGIKENSIVEVCPRKLMGVTCPRLCFVCLALLVCITIIAITRFSLKPIMITIDSQLSKTFYNRLDKYDPRASKGPDVIVRSVYFDHRSRYAHHNTTVFMIEVRKHYLYRVAGLITGCKVGGLISNDIKIHPIYINGKAGKIVDEVPSLTHAMAMVDCYDLPVQNGSRAALLYRTNVNGFTIPAESERPLFIPPRGNKQNGPPYRIAACIAVVYGRPSFLEDWIQYHRVVGVDHIHMIAEDSFREKGGLELPQVKNALSSGYLSIDVWKVWLRTNTEIHYHSQMLAYQDCIYRSQGVYDYMLVADQDDFFVPLTPNQSSLHWYIDKWCPRGACVFNWVEYYPDCGLSSSKGLPPGNVTSRLVSKTLKRLPFTKSLYRVSDTVEVGIHDPREMMYGTGAVSVPSSEGYVAHVRLHRRPWSGC